MPDNQTDATSGKQQTALLQHFEQYIRLSADLQNALLSRVSFAAFKKGTII
jgi:hypothetical protein